LGGEKLKPFSTLGAALIFAAGLLILGPAPLCAQTVEEAPSPAEESALPNAERGLFLGETAAPAALESPSSVFTLLRMVLVLALVALAVYGVIFFIKRAGRPRGLEDPHLRVLARVNLGGTSSAAVLAVGTRAWLGGAGEGGVSLITELEEQEALDAMFLDESARKEEAGKNRFADFRSLFRQVRRDLPPAPPPGAESLRQRRDRLRGL
jgi:flagellar biogenesis protein FliO